MLGDMYRYRIDRIGDGINGYGVKTQKRLAVVQSWKGSVTQNRRHTPISLEIAFFVITKVGITSSGRSFQTPFVLFYIIFLFLDECVCFWTNPRVWAGQSQRAWASRSAPLHSPCKRRCLPPLPGRPQNSFLSLTQPFFSGHDANFATRSCEESSDPDVARKSATSDTLT